MSQTVLLEIEETISQLSEDEQLVLISRIAEKLRDKNSDFENGLVEMANDAQIQNELREIERDFQTTELDGLD